MLPRRRKFAVFVEHVAQVHVAHGVVRMTRHGFRVSCARGGAIPGGIEQRTQIIQRQAMRGLARQYIQIGISSFQRPAQFGQQTGALESQNRLRQARRDARSRSRNAASRARCGGQSASAHRQARLAAAPPSAGQHGASQSHGLLHQQIDLASRPSDDSQWPRESPDARRSSWWMAPPARTPAAR